MLYHLHTSETRPEGAGNAVPTSDRPTCTGGDRLMAKSIPFPTPIERISSRDAGVVGLRANLDTLPSRELLDQYAVICMLPEPLLAMSVTRLTIIRDILLDRLDRPA